MGQSGVELQYNDLLMGKDGSRRVLVNSKGKEVGRPPNAIIPAVPGQKLKLRHIDIQKAAEQAMEGKNGAVVAMDPRNGEILAMLSRPTFDPNDFAVRISAKEWTRLVEDPAHPLLTKPSRHSWRRALCSRSSCPWLACRKAWRRICASTAPAGAFFTAVTSIAG